MSFQNHKGIILIIGLAAAGTVLLGNMEDERSVDASKEIWITGQDIKVTAMPDGMDPVEFKCEVAMTQEERTAGLSDRERLPEGRGMLFVYDSPARRSFWMYNVSFGLDIIFMDENGLVLNVEEASPGAGIAKEDLPHYYSNGKAMYVLEINIGVSAESGVGPGTRIDFILQ
ncbi:MAG: DUF192 domain-containing protein [Thermoplasmatota archaeon]